MIDNEIDEPDFREDNFGYRVPFKQTNLIKVNTDKWSTEEQKALEAKASAETGFGLFERYC